MACASARPCAALRQADCPAHRSPSSVGHQDNQGRPSVNGHPAMNATQWARVVLTSAATAARRAGALPGSAWVWTSPATPPSVAGRHAPALGPPMTPVPTAHYAAAGQSGARPPAAVPAIYGTRPEALPTLIGRATRPRRVLSSTLPNACPSIPCLPPVTFGEQL
jgi:hypothetical protein